MEIKFNVDEIRISHFNLKSFSQEERHHWHGEEESHQHELNQGEDAATEEESQSSSDRTEQVKEGEGINLGYFNIKSLEEQFNEDCIFFGASFRQLPEFPSSFMSIISENCEWFLCLNGLLNTCSRTQLLDLTHHLWIISSALESSHGWHHHLHGLSLADREGWAEVCCTKQWENTALVLPLKLLNYELELAVVAVVGEEGKRAKIKLFFISKNSFSETSPLLLVLLIFPLSAELFLGQGRARCLFTEAWPVHPLLLQVDQVGGGGGHQQRVHLESGDVVLHAAKTTLSSQLWRWWITCWERRRRQTWWPRHWSRRRPWWSPDEKTRAEWFSQWSQWCWSWILYHFVTLFYQFFLMTRF